MRFSWYSAGDVTADSILKRKCIMTSRNLKEFLGGTISTYCKRRFESAVASHTESDVTL